MNVAKDVGEAETTKRLKQKEAYVLDLAHSFILRHTSHTPRTSHTIAMNTIVA